MNKEKKEEIKEESKYNKIQILQSKKYGNRIDILSVLLKDDVLYSFSEINSIIDEFMKRKVE